MAIDAIVVLQVLTGLGLLAHGIPKLTNLKGTMQFTASQGFTQAAGLYAALVESVGAFLLIIGVFPRVMAALIALNMLGAMTSHWKNKDDFDGGWEPAYLYFSAAIVIVLAGAGWPALSL